LPGLDSDGSHAIIKEGFVDFLNSLLHYLRSS